jgi:hypothetical protein
MTGPPFFARIRSSLTWLIATLALVFALAAALLAQDVRSWRDILRIDTVSYGISPSAPERWTAPTILPSLISGRLLGVARARRELSALRFFALAHALNLANTGLTTPASQLFQSSEESLARVALDPDPAVASQAYELLAVVLFEDARGSNPPDLATYLSAVAAMQNAVRADDSNQQAKTDLELILRQEQADLAQNPQFAPSNEGSHRGTVAGRGKGAAPPKSREGDY